MNAYFEIIGKIEDIQIIAIDKSINDVKRLRRLYGMGRWRKLKGTARVRFKSGIVRLAELHWYEAHGIGRREIRIKRYLDRRT
jgi:hypothetical protein